MNSTSSPVELIGIHKFKEHCKNNNNWYDFDIDNWCDFTTNDWLIKRSICEIISTKLENLEIKYYYNRNNNGNDPFLYFDKKYINPIRDVVLEFLAYMDCSDNKVKSLIPIIQEINKNR